MYVWRVPEESPTRALQMELWDVFITRGVLESQQGAVITFVGSLQRDADAAFRALKQRFSRHSYTPMLRRQRGEDVIMAVPRVVRPLVSSRPVVHLALLLVLHPPLIFGYDRANFCRASREVNRQ